MDARGSRSNIVSETFFYRKVYNLRRPHTPDEFTLGMKVDVERRRIEIIISQPAPRPECNPSPRELPAVDTGSEEPGTLRRSPAIGTGSDKPGVSQTESTEKEEIFPLETSVDGCLLVVFFVFCLLSIVVRFCYPQCPKAGMRINDNFYRRRR